MATYITPEAVAKMGIIALLNSWIFASLVYRDYSKEFKKVGQDVIVKKPNTFTAIDFDGDLAGQWQEPSESSVTVSMDTQIIVPIQVTAVDLTLKINDFYGRIVEPAVQAIADEVDVRLAKLFVDIPYFENTETTTGIADLLNARKIMVNNKAPLRNLYAVMSPLTTASLLALAAFHEADKSGTTRALREASLGRVFGYEFFENQNIQTHAIGSSDVGGIIDVAVSYPAGTTTIHIDNLASADTIAKGTLITITGNTGQYVTTADVTLASNEADFPIYPALNATVLNDAVMAFNPSATTSKDNLMFHRNAFAMVSAPIEPPIGGAKGSTVNYKGISLNVVQDYDIDTQLNKMTISLLCGFKTLTPELAVRLHDES